MAKGTLNERLLTHKRAIFLATVKRICKRRGIPEPSLNFDGCEDENEDQLAHYHPGEHRICVSARQLAKMNYDKVESVASHEITHALASGHGPDFKDHKDINDIHAWKPGGGVVWIRPGTIAQHRDKPEQPTQPNKSECQYHLCHKRSALKKCERCGLYFCPQHLTALPPRVGGFSDRDPIQRAMKKRYSRNDFHPCRAFMPPKGVGDSVPFCFIDEDAPRMKIDHGGGSHDISPEAAKLIAEYRANPRKYLTDRRKRRWISQFQKSDPRAQQYDSVPNNNTSRPAAQSHDESTSSSAAAGWVKRIARDEPYPSVDPKYKRERIEPRDTYPEMDDKYRREAVGTRPTTQPTTQARVRAGLSSLWRRLASHLNTRRHTYVNWHPILTGVMWVGLLTLSIDILLEKIDTLNEIHLWIFPFGGCVLLVLLIVYVVISYRLIVRLRQLYRGAMNWARYLVIILIFALLLFVYHERDTLSQSLINRVHQFNMSRVFPLQLAADTLSAIPSKINGLIDSPAIQQALNPSPTRPQECKDAFATINRYRTENGRAAMEWDDSLYELAVARSQDMVERYYFDHVTPDGKCVKDFKANYGFAGWNVAENCGGMTHYENGDPIPSTSVEVVVISWMSSRGHKYNLLYPAHTRGAVGCYKAICVFLGANLEPYGLGSGPCTTGEQGLAYWKSAGKQPGEV